MVRDIIQDNGTMLIDIRDTLNHHGSFCTNEQKSLFDSRAVINHWSFRKPYAIYDGGADRFVLTDEKIRNNNCGLDATYAQMASYTSLPERMDGDMNGWVYNRPVGGEESPLRLSDYIGYYPSAFPMICNFHAPSVISKKESTKIEVTAVVTKQDGKSVTLSDLLGLSDMEAAVYIKKSDDDLWNNIRNENVKLVDGSFNVSISIDDFQTTGTWILYPYMTNGNAHFMIPNVSSRPVTVVDTFYRTSIMAEKETDGSRTIYWAVRVVNRSGEDYTFNNNHIFLRISGKELDDPSYDEGEKRLPLSDGLVVYADATTTIAQGAFTDIHDNVWKSPKVGVMLNSGNYTAFVDVITPYD